jgi:hypothetical protein
METAQMLGVFARDLLEEDLIDCLSVNPARLGGELVGRTRAIKTWRALIRFPAWTSGVIEAPKPIGGHRIVGFGGDVFVSRAFADAEISKPRPGLNSRLIASIDSGETAVLSESEVRAGNTRGGLDMAILYGSWRREILSPAAVCEVCTALAARFLEMRQGFQVNRIVTETVNAQETSQYLATHAWREIGRFDRPGGESRSILVITRDDAMAVAASFINPLFHYRKPVLLFREADQKLLLAALGGLTDEELSRKLGFTLSAIKKRWISVFDRTIHTRPDVFPEVDGRNDGAKRSRQKRHHILAYVRAHPEELRPIVARRS